jgi:hypothetical protein
VQNDLKLQSTPSLPRIALLRHFSFNCCESGLTQIFLTNPKSVLPDVYRFNSTPAEGFTMKIVWILMVVMALITTKAGLRFRKDDSIALRQPRACQVIS